MWKGAKGIYDDYYIILDNGRYISTDDEFIIQYNEFIITGVDSEYNIYVFDKKNRKGAKYVPDEFVSKFMQSPHLKYVYNSYMERIQKNKEQTKHWQ